METINSSLTIKGSLDTQKNLQVNGNAFVYGGLDITGTISGKKLVISSQIEPNGPSPLNVQTNFGYMHIGARNSAWAHFYTNLPKYYFNKEVRVNSGMIGSYDEDLVLKTKDTERLRIKINNGNVGIGTNAPKTKLHVQGNRIRVSHPTVPNHHIDIRADGAALDIETSKNLYLNNNGNKVLYRKMEKVSSRKFKKAIEALTTINARQLLDQLKPVKYIYKTDPEQKLQLGFIAEEIPDEIAAKDKASIDPMDIITILCKVVQDHQKTINQLIA